MKVAIIGAGAAAIGVLAGFERCAASNVEITLFDVGRKFQSVPESLAERGFQREDFASLYRQIRARHGVTFPPPKSHFGESASKYSVEGKPLLWKSESRGGLTNLWGGGMFPFTDREFKGWPVSAAEMDPYYRIIADKVGVCGEPDELSRNFPFDYTNRPPLRTSPVIHVLCGHINRHASVVPSAGYRIVAGSSRLALETRVENKHSCVYTGECMLGCPREAIWCASQELERYKANSLISHNVIGRVRFVKNRYVHYQIPGRESGETTSAGPFDRIYLAAGCIGSTEIVMRSLGLSQGPIMLDNAVLSFPIFYAGFAGGARGGSDPYFALCNLSMLGFPIDPAEEVAQVSVYPSFDHLWRYYMPEILWSPMRRIWSFARWRLLLGRVFLAGKANRTFKFFLEEDELVIRRGSSADVALRFKSFLRSLRQATNRSGFFIPPFPPLGHGTSSHYAGTFPYGGGLLNLPRDGRIEAGVHLADSSTFVGSPAISPTFTIMANACRTVHESLQN